VAEKADARGVTRQAPAALDHAGCALALSRAQLDRACVPVHVPIERVGRFEVD
jgi:hypothetical protein